MHPADRTILGEPSRPRAVVNAAAVGRTVGPGHHAEQAASQCPTNCVQLRQYRHAFNGTAAPAHEGSVDMQPYGCIC